MNRRATALSDEVSVQLEEKLPMLFQDKHLYQGIQIEDKDDNWANDTLLDGSTPSIGSRTTSAVLTLDLCKNIYSRYVAQTPWNILMPGDLVPASGQDQFPSVSLTPIDSYCPRCDLSPRAFSPSAISDGRNNNNPSGKREQSWLIVFECAKCQQPIEFMLVREGNKLDICGRSPIEFQDVAKVIPKRLHKHISNANITADANFLLAGVLYLRTAVEQFLVSQKGVKAACAKLPGRPTGDDLGDAYNDLLPVPFKQSFPSLKDLYADLSTAIHSAKTDRKAFDEMMLRFTHHFEGRSAFKLKDDSE
jgi:hypothetical protein